MNNYKIIRNKEFLKQDSEPVTSIEEGLKIGEYLKRTLDSAGGVGLSAPQIGIRKRVCIVHAKKEKEPIVLVNPRITASDEIKILYYEGCLSLPKSNYTIRHKTVKVAADNLDTELEFGPSKELTIDEYRRGDHLNSNKLDEGLLEAVAVQHELDHLDGILITDPSVKVSIHRPIINTKKYGRNEKVVVKNPKTQESKFIKYKIAIEFVNQGWEII